MAIKKSELQFSLWASYDEPRGGMDASQNKCGVVSSAQITIPEGASVTDMVSLKGKPDIGDQINKMVIGPLANTDKLSDIPIWCLHQEASKRRKPDHAQA